MRLLQVVVTFTRCNISENYNIVFDVIVIDLITYAINISQCPAFERSPLQPPSRSIEPQTELDPEDLTTTQQISRLHVNLRSATNFFRLRNSDGRRTTALVTLSGNNLVVEVAQVHSQLGPSIEVVGSGHSAAGTLALADGPVLVEGRSALDGGLVDLLVLVDVVGSAIAVDGTLVGHARPRVVGTIVLEDVVLDEGASSPAINSKVGITRGVEGAREVDVPVSEMARC